MASPSLSKSEKCHVCHQTVYAMEKMAADGLVFHKNCMKCEECGKSLGLGNYAALSGKYYCKPHFKQLFALKGNYSEGFGEEKPTAKWQAQASDSPQQARAHSPAPTVDVATTDVVKSESVREDASSVVASGSGSQADARKRFQELSVPASDAAALSPGATRKGSASPFSVRREVCHVCGKTVYEMEKMAADGLTFHKNCMKCTECGKTLGLGNYAALSGKYYCKPHFKQLFALKGNYSEGFGEEKPTAKWTKKDGASADGADQSPAHTETESTEHDEADQEAPAVADESSDAAAAANDEGEAANEEEAANE